MRTLPFICLFFIILFGQKLFEGEQKYSDLSHLLKKEKIKLDSLNQILDKKANLIDNEKKKVNPDINKITKLMAETIVIASQVEEQQKNIEQIQGNIIFLKQILYQRYSIMIDSLKTLENSVTDKEKKNELKMKIISYTQKKLYFSPDIPLLSFNPEKILDIDLTSCKDSLEKMIYLEYMKNALTEVEGHLAEITKLRSEINEMIMLEKKTESFLNELDDEGEIERYYISKPEKLMNNKPPPTSGNDWYITAEDRSSIEDYMSSNIILLQSYSSLLNNLVMQRSNIVYKKHDMQTTWEALTDSTKKNLNIYSYQDLLKELEKGLFEYKMILMHKLESIKNPQYLRLKKKNKNG
jgi:hypothetical protein